MHTRFFNIEVPALLANLSADTPSLWGTMNATAMLEHLHTGTKLFLAKQMMPLEVAEEQLPGYKAFLMSDKNMMKGAPKPEGYVPFESAESADFETVKASFLAGLQLFEAQTKQDPEFWCFHPSFGRLNAAETRQLQFKHIRHHFQQFGLLPRI